MVDAAGGSSVSSGAASFSYDNLYQLRSGHDGTLPDPDEAYGYSVSGDPITLGDTTAVFNPAHELCWSTTGTVTAPSCGTAPQGATAYGFDAAGDRVGVGGAVFGFDSRGLMTTAPNATYSYDPDGVRVSKTVNGTTTVYGWDDSGSLGLLLSDGNYSYVYGPGGRVVSRLGSTKADTRWIGHDGNDSVTLATNNTAAVTTTNTYTPWGVTRTHTGETINLGYNSQYNDPETGYLYLRARYYDPTTAQFLTRDPLDTSTRSAYGYGGNDQLNQDDPTGLYWGESFVHKAGHALSSVGHAVAHVANEALPVIHSVSGVVAAGTGICAVGLAVTGIGGAACGAVALAASGISAVSGTALYLEGRESKSQAYLDSAGALLSAGGSLLGAGAEAADLAATNAEGNSYLAALRGADEPWYGKVGPWLRGSIWDLKAGGWSALGQLERALGIGLDVGSLGTGAVGLAGCS